MHSSIIEFRNICHKPVLTHWFDTQDNTYSKNNPVCVGWKSIFEMTRDMMSGVEKLVDARMQNMLIVNSELRFVLKSRAAASGTAVDERRSVYLKMGGAHCAGGT
jgi:hypothetical protein